MLPDRVSNPEPPTYVSGALPIALRGPARSLPKTSSCHGVVAHTNVYHFNTAYYFRFLNIVLLFREEAVYLKLHIHEHLLV